MNVASTVYETGNPSLTYECPICFDPILCDEYICFSECSHKYHLKCIQDWKNQSCPDLVYCFKCPICDEIRNIDIENSYIEFDYPKPKPKSRNSLLKKIRRCIRNIGCR